MFDDINEQSFVDDSNSDNENHDNLHGVLADWNDLPQPVNPHQHGSVGGQGHHNQDQPIIPSQDHDFQSQVHVVMRPRVGPERSHIPEPRPQNVETEVLFLSFFYVTMPVISDRIVTFELDYGADKDEPWS